MANIEIDQFTEGLTDNYVNGSPSAAKKLDNLLVNEDGKLVQRPGITIYNSSAPQIPAGNQRIDSFHYFDSTLFVKSGTKLYYISDGSSSWSTLAGPTGNDAFADSEVGSKASWSEWNGHLFITPGPSANNKAGCRTVKVYRNTSAAWTLVQAGLPKAYRNTTSALPADVTGNPTVTYYSLFVRGYFAQVRGVNTYFIDYGSPTVFQSTANVSFNTDLGYSITHVNSATENYDTADMRSMLFRTKIDGIEAYVDSIWPLATNHKIYTALDRNLEESKPEIDVTAENFSAAGQLTISTIDAKNFFFAGREVVTSGAGLSGLRMYVTSINYSTGVLTLSATRGGSAYTGTAYSTSEPLYVVLGETLYPGATDGFFNDPVPRCYFQSISDGYGWYGAVDDVDSGGMRANRILQSKPGDVDSVPGGNYVDVPGDSLTALAHAGPHPVAFVRNKCFRLEGRFDAFGGGGVRAVVISEVEGSVSQDVIKTPDGILFPSENGWCFTNGFTVVNLSKYHLRDTYAALSTKTRMSGCFDSKKNLAFFGVESASLVPSVSGKNNALFVLDQTRSSNKGVFSTASSGENLQPNALHYDSANSRVLIGDHRGYVFKLDDDLTTDPVVDTGASWSAWVKQGIVWDYMSCALALGSTRLSKWMGGLYSVFKNLTGDLSVDFNSYKDDRSTAVRMKTSRERSITSGLHKVFRSFPKGNLSCIYAQIEMKKGFVVIVRSDDYALATFSGSGNTAQLATGSWPNDGTESLVGYSLYPIIASAYDTGWTISAQSGDTLTVLDPENTLPTGSFKWVIKGYPKNESVELHSLSIDYEVLQEGYPERSAQGGNA